MTQAALRRLILTIKPDGHELRVLYRREAGPNPGTVRRRREVEQLARTGLTAALAALGAGETEMVGTAGFTTRRTRSIWNPYTGRVTLWRPLVCR